ncbi:MAG: right-handed parallel beta-helix repeat-containing protein [Candidatus Binatia bacterium]
MHPLIRGMGLMFAALLWSAPSAGAATFVVNSTLDLDHPSCGAVIGACTLRDAMSAAVATPGLDTIAFDPAVFPPGDPSVITVSIATPVLTDPAGTIVDGAGAGVVIQSSFPIVQEFDALVFASGPGAPLAKVRVANLTLLQFRGAGIVVCGGAYPACDGDVVKPVIENVVVASNVEAAGLRIEGRDVTKARLMNVVARGNGHAGIQLEADRTLSGTRIDGCTALDDGQTNGASGILLEAGETIAGTSINDSISVGNGGVGFRLRSEGTLSKTKLTRVVATRNLASGIQVFGVGATSGIAITDATTVANGFEGIALTGGSMSGTTIKNAVTNRNGDEGIRLSPFDDLAGAKLTGVRAVGNGQDGIATPQGAGAVSGVEVSRSIVTANGGVGIHLVGSQHLVKRVHADANGAGIHLDAPGGGSIVKECTAHANDGTPGGAGIRVAAGSTGNVLTKNAAQGNDGPNLADGNANCAGNVWKDNFAVTDAACLD